MRDILFLAIGDWGNVGASLAAAGRSVGMDCISFDYCHHPFDYHIKSSLLDEVDPNSKGTGHWNMKKYADEFKAVVLMQSRSPGFFAVEKRSWQKWAVFHGTNPFQPSWVDFNKICDVQFCQTSDMLGHGLVNEQWLIPPVDTEYIKPIFSESETIKSKGLIFGHNARHGGTKGTPFINEIMEKFRGRCTFESSSEVTVGGIIPWSENIKRMGKYDVYILALGIPIMLEKEQLAINSNGVEYYTKLSWTTLTGEWGITALETAALGKIVVAQFAGISRYEKEFNCVCPFVVIEADHLDIAIEKVLSFSPEKIVEIQRQTRKWVEDAHSYKPTGLRLKKFLID
jgi:hypothetical protein